MNKKTSGAVCRTFALLLLTGLLSTQVITGQGWYDADWLYRSPVTVPHPIGAGGTELTDFQVKVTLTNGSNFDFARILTPNGSDIRFTAADGTTLIPFWIESWTAGISATIWVKVPSIPTTGTTVYVYSGNASPTLPSSDPVETPPIGPFTRAVGNPIVPSGAGANVSLLAENIVYDPVTKHYWMCLANYSNFGIALCYSDTPTVPNSWIWSGNVITTFNHFISGAPHLLFYNGIWYLFYSDRPNIMVATSTAVGGPYTINPTPMLSPSGPAPAWDNFRVDEPYVFQRADGKWIMIYMGDSGGAVEQVGYATADNITGPYTIFAGNPCLRFGLPGSFDAGTIADPWVYEYHGVFYIGYTVSSTNLSPWQTALATTTDWINFTKHGVILPAAGTVNDAANSFRGALTRIGNEYVFSYTNDGYRMAIATQPVFMTPPDIINRRDAVFDFYDDFDGTAVDWTKWTIAFGNATQATVSGGLLNLNAPTEGSYVRINGITSFGPGYIGETRAYHPDQGTLYLIAEVGFATTLNNAVRIVDDFKLGITYWQRQAINGGTDDTQPFANMAQTADQAWHTFRVFRQSPDIAGFQIDDNPIETTTSFVPMNSLYPFLMSYGTGNDFVIDWTRVRKWAGADPAVTVGTDQNLARWTGTGGAGWGTAGSWSTNAVPVATDDVAIVDALNDPEIATAVSINSLIIEPGASLTVSAAGSLTAARPITINSSGTANSGSLINLGTLSGSVIYNRFLRPQNNFGERHFFSSPVGGQTISGFMMNNFNLGQLWEYNEVTGTWPTVGTGSFVSGKGYNLAQTLGSLGEYTFTGSVVSSATFIATSPYLSTHTVRNTAYDYGLGNPGLIWSGTRSWTNYGGGGWNLMGNPFTSAMNTAAFITENSNKIDPHYQALYVYDGVSGTYLYSAAAVPGFPAGITSHGSYVQAGQGFFVLALYDGAVFNFNSSMQVHQPTVSLLKSAEADDDPWPGLQLKVRFGNKESLTTVVYNEAMTTGSDPGYDIGQMSSGPEVEIYTALAAGDNSINYTRQALPVTGADKIFVPVGIDSKQGGEVEFSAETRPFGNNRFWLEDRTTGSYTDITTKSYTVTLPSNTYGTGRFYIIASTNAPTGIRQPQPEDTAVRIWISNENAIIKGEVSNRAVCEIYDLRGKKILETQLADGELNTVTLPSGLHGVYLIRVIDGVKVTTRKVAII